MSRAYYGGYFGRIAGVVNPCSSYWTKAGYWTQEDSQYQRYLYGMYKVFQDAAKAAYEHSGISTFERKGCIRKRDYEALQATADYYHHRYLVSKG